jgi:hypothetical protein
LTSNFWPAYHFDRTYLDLAELMRITKSGSDVRRIFGAILARSPVISLTNIKEGCSVDSTIFFRHLKELEMGLFGANNIEHKQAGEFG